MVLGLNVGFGGLGHTSAGGGRRAVRGGDQEPWSYYIHASWPPVFVGVVTLRASRGSKLELKLESFVYSVSVCITFTFTFLVCMYQKNSFFPSLNPLPHFTFTIHY